MVSTTCAGHTYRLRGHVEGLEPGIHTSYSVHARDDVEHAWSNLLATLDTTQSEDDSSFILRDNSNNFDEREREEEDDEDDGENCE